MTDRQKEAILLLNELAINLSNEQYFLLLEFIISNPQQVTYTPYPWNDGKDLETQPIITMYGCQMDSSWTSTEPKEEE